jgi:hypothetical protein
MCDFEDTDLISRYTRSQAVADGILVELIRYNSLPVMATAHIKSELSLSELLDVWQEFRLWKAQIEPRLPGEERLFQTARHDKKVWVIDDPEACTILYPEDY